jgi:hypothetical protein
MHNLTFNPIKSAHFFIPPWVPSSIALFTLQISKLPYTVKTRFTVPPFTVYCVRFTVRSIYRVWLLSPKTKNWHVNVIRFTLRLDLLCICAFPQVHDKSRIYCIPNRPSFRCLCESVSSSSVGRYNLGHCQNVAGLSEIQS